MKEPEMSFVLVVDQERKPLAPVHPGRARHLLTAGHAAVLRRYPFTLILKAPGPETLPDPLRLKIDPGSKTTGLAVLHDTTGQVVWAAEVAHRGEQVTERLAQRRACRRSRRQRHTRYRPARFANRRRHAGWLPPSLESRLATVLTWVARLRRSAPIGAISLELVKFDTQLMQHAEISGVEYQQGECATRSGFTSCLKGGNALMRPVIPLTVPYRNVRPQQWDGAKLSGQCNPRHRDDHRPRERNVGLLASSG
jgi:RRXRR protein